MCDISHRQIQESMSNPPLFQTSPSLPNKVEKYFLANMFFFFCHPTWPSNAKTLYSVLRYWVTKASFHKVLSLLTAEALSKRVRLFLDAACASLTDYSIFSLCDILFLRRKISINFIIKTNQYVTL